MRGCNTTSCFFVSDLHGHVDRYEKLFAAIADERPAAVFLGGDLLPSGLAPAEALDVGHRDFVNDFLAANFSKLRKSLAGDYARVMLILGNDDPRFEESAILDVATRGVWEYIHARRTRLGETSVYGYAFVPPTPFMFKDWERYDVSRYVDVGCTSPEEGHRSVPMSEHEIRYTTIREDLERLVGDDALDRAVFLFHSPPYQSHLDRAALDGRVIDHVPLDVHVGSIAIKKFIERHQPLVTLHGHVHESTRLTGSWKDRIGRTVCLSAAHDGPELALVRFDLEDPAAATRELI
ncbi:MAG: metallophosphoesterase [Phycisphaerae bacterium]